MNDEFYMSLAINKAWKYQILTYPNPAVGCVVLDKFGRILACEAHKRAGFLHAEPTAIFFALCELSDEFLAKFMSEYQVKFGVNLEENEIYSALADGYDFYKNSEIKKLSNLDLDAAFTYEFILKNHGNLLQGAKAYVTLEPCAHHGKTPSCANLLKILGFSEVIIGAYDENETASGGGEILRKAGVKVKFGVLKERACELIEPFSAWRSGNFSFFKLALSANGVATDGIISNELSRTHMHALRSVIDMLVIGGNSMRVDRPTLDTRLIKNGKNPNVLIYSRSQNFDRTIPLFSVPNRKVEISDSLENAFKSGLTMIEGGENALRNLDPRVKWLLIYRSNEFKEAENLKAILKSKPLFSANLGDGSYTWYRC